MAKPRRENTATQVYAAQGDDCVKVGVSRIVGKREKQLRDHGGDEGRPALGKTRDEYQHRT